MIVAAHVTESETRARLLQAACAVFAAQGFRAATVREICGQAGVNVAAVGYHFGSKEALYAEALKASALRVVAQYPATGELADGAAWQDRLRVFIGAVFARMGAQGEQAWHGQMVSREMIEPTPALQGLVDEVIRPQAACLGAIVRDALGPAAPDAMVQAGARSVIGQCLFYHHCRPVLERLDPGAACAFGPAQMEVLAAQVADFSIAALQALSAGRAPAGGAR